MNRLRSLVGRACGVAAALTMMCSAVSQALAQPALDQARAAGPLTVYPDAEVPGRFYYPPGPLELARRGERPGVSFLLTRRTGRLVTGDQGESQLFAHLSFDVERRPVRADALEAARRSLAADGVSRPELRLLPVKRTEARVVFAPLAGGEAVTLSAGDFEVREASRAPAQAQMLEKRRYTLRLDRHSAEAMWKMLEKGRTLVSFSYAYFADGVIGSGVELKIEDQLGREATFRNPSSATEPSESADGAEATAGAGSRAVHADAFEVTLDPQVDGDLIRVVDLNAERPPPPGHGVLDIRCYDFRNGLRPDLAMKMVELEGEAANGRPAHKLVIFRAAEPDEAVHRVRFPFAVRLDASLRYRVREIATDGEELDLGWEEHPWIGVLDVTTASERLDNRASAALAMPNLLLATERRARRRSITLTGNEEGP